MNGPPDHTSGCGPGNVACGFTACSICCGVNFGCADGGITAGRSAGMGVRPRIERRCKLTGGAAGGAVGFFGRPNKPTCIMFGSWPKNRAPSSKIGGSSSCLASI